MKIRDYMSKHVVLGHPEMKVAQAAQLMAEGKFGILPIQEDDRLVGVITDRDIAIRCVALNKDHQTPVSEVMTEEVLYCFDDQSVEEAIDNLGKNKIWRLPVVNREKRLVGIVSLCDLSCAPNESKGIDHTLRKLSFKSSEDLRNSIHTYQYAEDHNIII